jgi:hypothetical protein
MYEAGGAGFLNVSDSVTGHYNEAAIKDAERSYTPNPCIILPPLIASLHPALSNLVSPVAYCQI